MIEFQFSILLLEVNLELDCLDDIEQVKLLLNFGFDINIVDK